MELEDRRASIVDIVLEGIFGQQEAAWGRGRPQCVLRKPRRQKRAEIPSPLVKGQVVLLIEAYAMQCIPTVSPSLCGALGTEAAEFNSRQR